MRVFHHHWRRGPGSGLPWRAVQPHRPFAWCCTGIAATNTLLLSAEADITGAVLPVDGGLTLS